MRYALVNEKSGIIENIITYDDEKIKSEKKKAKEIAKQELIDNKQYKENYINYIDNREKLLKELKEKHWIKDDKHPNGGYIPKESKFDIMEALEEFDKTAPKKKILRKLPLGDYIPPEGLKMIKVNKIAEIGIVFEADLHKE